jgi:S1-C subfamily serine protease
MSLITANPALPRSVIAIGLLLAVPALAPATPSASLLQAGATTADSMVCGQIFITPGLPTVQPYSPSNPYPYPYYPTYPTYPSYYPQPPVTVVPITPPTNPQPTGQYSLGIGGSFVNQGMLIQKVTPGSPADKAGLMPGDLVLKMDGVTVTNQGLFNQVLSASGGVVQMVVQRKSQVVQLVVVLGVDGPRISAPYILGISGNYTIMGMQVLKVYSGTPAAKAGIKVADQIISINNFPIGNDAQFYQTVYSSSGCVGLQVRRGGQTSFVKVKLQLARFGSLGTYTAAGSMIEIVQPTTPASRAGFGQNDWILAIDGKNVNSQAAFENAINLSEGTVIMQAKKAFGGVPGPVGVELMNNSLGCWCLPAVGGMRLLNAPQNTFSSAIGLNKGDIILQIDNRNTQSLSDLQFALEQARGNMVVTYRSGISGQVLQLNVNLGQFFN